MTYLENGAILDTDSYLYVNQEWEDQLTSFNGKEIIYDNIGNPLTIGSDISLSWINGRSLKSYSDTSKSLNVSYKYNNDGVRYEKTVNGSTTKYYLEGTNIVYEEKGTRTIYYLYDATGVIGLKYNNSTYLFEKNLQGDIIGIVDSLGKRIVTYEYDSWGKVLSIKDKDGNEISNQSHIGIINPFRYRGYYYDSETGLYYLNSRYYNPEWCRFINADEILGANQDILSYNLYAYVSNNPTLISDVCGTSIFTAIGRKIGNFAYNMVKKYKGLNKEEKRVTKKYPVSAYRSYKSAEKATSMGRKIYGSEIDNDMGVANAYKHAMWNAIMTVQIGAEKAKSFSDAHEYGQTDMAATNMDYDNNLMGISIANIYISNRDILNSRPYFTQNSDYFMSYSIPTQSFNYLGKKFTITKQTDPYAVMSDMVQHAIAKGVAVVLIS